MEVQCNRPQDQLETLILNPPSRPQSMGPIPQCSISSKEETDTPLSEKEMDVMESKIKADFKWTHITLIVGLLLAYCLGFGGFSLAWILVVVVFVCSTCRNCVRTTLKQLLVVEQIKLHRKRALCENTETAEWLNFLLNKWWLFSSQSIYISVKEKLDPIISAAMPSFLEKIEIKQFTLGDETPSIKRVRSYQVSRGTTLTQVIENQVVIEVDFNLACNDFSMVFRARLGGKGVGVDLDIAVESLHIQGLLHAVVTLSLDSPFPHFSRLSIYFVEKPEVWFNVRILKAVQMMEVPIIKSWIHSLVTDALETALVDPGKLDIDLTTPDLVIPDRTSSNRMAQGVLIMSLSCEGVKSSGFSSDEDRWLWIRVGNHKQVTKPSDNVWADCKVFLVESLESDKLEIKLKSKRLINIITQGEFESPLCSYEWSCEKMNTVYLHKRGSKLVPSTTQDNALAVRMQYCPLSPIRFDSDGIPMAPLLDYSGTAGIVYVCIHRAEHLLTSCRSQEVNPYCIFFLNRKKMKTTHYIRKHSSPEWNCNCEFVVNDFSKIQFTFAVCNWTGYKDQETNMLGVANLHRKNDEQMINIKLPLSYTLQASHPTSRQQSFLYVSVIFRAVPTITGWIDGSRLTPSMSLDVDEYETPVVNKSNREGTHSLMRQAKMILSNRDSNLELTSLGDILKQGTGLMEFVICRAKDLVAKDLNGFSDPYCEVKVRNECRFKTSVKKNTLNPIWNECLTTSLPEVNETLDIVIWDQDPFGLKDFLGSTSLSISDLRVLSSKDTPEWIQLKNVKTGAIEIRVKIFAEYLPNKEHKESRGTNVPTQSYNSLRDVTSELRSEEQCRLKFHRSESLLQPLQLLIPNIPTSYQTQLSSPTPILQTSYSEYSKRVNNKSPTPSIMGSPFLKPNHSPVSVLSSDASVLCHSRDCSNDEYHSPKCFKMSPSEQSSRESSIRTIKGRIKRKMIAPLRRFRSEVTVNEKPSRRVCVEYHSPSEFDDSDVTDVIDRAQSQPDISRSAMKPLIRQPDMYYSIRGRIRQVQGIKPIRAGVQIYCHIKLFTYTCYPHNQDKASATHRTIAKSKFLPAGPNPHFNLSFDLSPSSGLTKDCALNFELKTSGKDKEVLGSRTISLQDIFSGTPSIGDIAHHWLRMDNDATMEIEIQHNRPRKTFPGRDLFKSWSVHRIGRV